MKKSLILLGAAILALVSCAKTQVITSGSPTPIAFKAVVNNAVKADAQLEGINLGDDYAMYVSAAQYKADGTIETPAYFTDAEFLPAATPVVPETQYHANPKLYWPIGNAMMDFIAYALPQAKHGAPLATYPAATDPVASMITFANWNTYDNQVDLLYDVKNGATTATNAGAQTVNFAFKHAQALLVFQAQVNDPGIITINKITMPELKVNGDFVIDNTKNVLNAHWENLAAVPTKDIVAEGATPAADNLGEALTSATYVQIGSSLLIPQQPRINFTINYTIGANTMDYTVNLPRGNWEMGKKYIYQLDITLNEIIATQVVSDYLDPANLTTETTVLN